MRRKTLLFLVAVVPVLLLFQYLYYTRDIKAPKGAQHNNIRYKNILYWTKMFGQEDFYLGLGSEIFQGCEVSNCYATSDKSYLPVEEFDAVLFHANEYYEVPENRSQHQYYIYFNMESPAYTPQRFGTEAYFNWTMTYRSDSDIPHQYGYYETVPTNYEMPTVEEVRKKGKIVWMVSNCDAVSDRNALFEKLNKLIPIDVYGACGSKSCPREDFEVCYDLLARNYKFYLSFENSYCAEYVTEKLYAALMRNFVPIVYGDADYNKIAPPNSAIDVTKFDSVKELAQHIKTLDEDPEKYLSYFEWKKDYTVKRDHKFTLCTLCKKLNEPVVNKTYTDIDKWWKSGMCKYENKLPKILFT